MTGWYQSFLSKHYCPDPNPELENRYPFAGWISLNKNNNMKIASLLPEKWYIESIDKRVLSYLNERYKENFVGSGKYYGVYNDKAYAGSTQPHFEDRGCTKITLEHFLHCVYCESIVTPVSNTAIPVCGASKKPEGLEPAKNLVGYKLKPGIDPIVVNKILDWGNDVAWNLSLIAVNAMAVKKLDVNGVLYILFDPVYEDVSKLINVYHGDRGSRGLLQVYIVNGKAKVEEPGSGISHFISKYELDNIVSDKHINSIKFLPTKFDIGCNGQYKNVSREDIQKVIDAL